MTVVKEVIIKEIELSDEQQDAVQQCCDFTKRVFAVTGLAGTGKTTILKQVHNELKAQSLANSIVLCAPTGRAAKRIQEATGISAVTIHRLLEFPKPSEDDIEIIGVGNTYAPRRNKSRPLIQRVILVDEASMIGPVLDGQLRDALRRDATTSRGR
jgi:exodeoxyribonuclease V alpha subunit